MTNIFTEYDNKPDFVYTTKSYEIALEMVRLLNESTKRVSPSRRWFIG